MTTRLTPRLCIVACMLSGWGAPAWAQQYVVLRGTVVEAGSGAPVSAAAIRSSRYGVSAVTRADGTWQLRLPAAAHELTVEHVGFATASARVTAGDSGAITIRLTPRAVSLEELVVTASRRLQQLKNVAVATEVVSREDILSTGSADLSAVLVERTGVAVEGGHPVGTGVMLQGLGSERVLVLLDGQPLIGRISGSLDLSRIPAAMVERVEVVKGPQSTLYGSEAMGGVINIITRAPERGVRDATIGVTGGSHDRLDVAGSVLGGTGALTYGADGGRRTIELVPGHGGDAGTFATRWNGSTRVQWQAAPSVSLHAGALLLDESQRWRTGMLYNFTDNVQWGARAGARVTRGARAFASELYVTEFRHLSRRSTLPRPVASDADDTEVQRLLEADLLYNAATGRVALDAGVEARRESIHSDRVAGADRTLHSIEPFAQVTWSADAWNLVPGIRVSWSEQWGAHVTPRVAMMIRPAERVALRAAVGRGFRAPSFKELYMEFLNTAAGAGYRVQGNPGLQPETSTNVSGSAEWTGERLYARMQLFYNRFDDFIETREVADGGDLTLFVYGNVDDGETYGAEAELGATWRGLRAEAGYGWLRALDRRSGEKLLGRPAHSARSTLSYAMPFGLRASAGGSWTSSAPARRAEDGSIIERAALTRIDARIAQELPRGFELSIGMDNVLDDTIEEYPGYLGRQLYLGVTWSGTRR